jgi:hypothetical protein
MDYEHADFSNHANGLPPLLSWKTVWTAYAQRVLENKFRGYKIQSVLVEVFPELPFIPSPAHKCTLFEVTIM